MGEAVGIDIVLCRPGLDSKAEAKWAKELPLGLAYLAAAVRNEGFSTAVIDAKREGHLSPEKTAEAILAHEPSFAGISALTVDFRRAAEIARLLRRARPGIVSIIGGVHVNALPEESLMEAEDADFVLAGQAEETLPQLMGAVLDSSPLDGISGLYRRGPDGAVLGRPPVAPDTDLTAIPMPAWDLFPRTNDYPVMGQRGCPFHCVFCGHNMTRRLRSRPVGHVLTEIRMLVEEYGARHICFEDETFNLQPEWTSELLEGLAELNRDHRTVFACQTRADCLTESLAEGLRKAGFLWVSLGVESGDPGMLEADGKGITVEQVETAFANARRAGLKLWPKFILGLPGETTRTAFNTIRFAARLNPERFSFAAIVPYPGSDIYRWALADERGYHLLTRDWSLYDKYGGISVELDTLSARKIKFLQMVMLVWVYLRNLRLGDLFRQVRQDLPLAGSMLRNTLMPKRSRAAAGGTRNPA